MSKTIVNKLFGLSTSCGRKPGYFVSPLSTITSSQISLTFDFSVIWHYESTMNGSRQSLIRCSAID